MVKVHLLLPFTPINIGRSPSCNNIFHFRYFFLLSLYLHQQVNGEQDGQDDILARETLYFASLILLPSFCDLNHHLRHQPMVVLRYIH